ncbi:MAG: cyclopropane-fatty-acyl-phospholipid synthase [Candidatus Marinimicrobia bacterium]|nr:cyclopropane-fatty-acyl-phospholipid synthase [Candidatus Neomarinimicrobiota bacterium]
MKKQIRVDQSANRLKKLKKSTLLVSIFKKIILKKFNNLKIGYIHLSEGNESYEFGNKKSELQANIKILSPEFYVFLGSGGLLGVTEAYTAGFWQADDIVTLIRIMIKNSHIMQKLDSGWAKLLKPINNYIHKKRQNTLVGSKENILAHYDLSNDFYKLWLDESMTYSCGVFETESSTLKEASIEKLDRICRKLNLSVNDNILEIGTGWGSFAIHAAKNYGCNITTTTISDAQYEYAKNKIAEEGLSDKITLLNKDYRNLSGSYDKIVSIEMIEAVGHEYVPLFFESVSKLLKKDGLFALQGITYNDHNFDEYKNSVDFIKKYIFPGSCLISISQITNAVKKKTDLSIVNLEDITMHYATTLNKWRNNFMDVIPAVKKLGFSSAFINMWEFYFHYCEAGFLERNIGDYQVIFAKSNARDINIRY